MTSEDIVPGACFYSRIDTHVRRVKKLHKPIDTGIKVVYERYAMIDGRSAMKEVGEWSLKSFINMFAWKKVECFINTDGDLEVL